MEAVQHRLEPLDKVIFLLVLVDLVLFAYSVWTIIDPMADMWMFNMTTTRDVGIDVSQM